MKNKLHILVHVFVFWAFLGGIIAPACGFAWGGTYSVVEICTAQGFENRIVMDDEQDTPHQMQEQCEFCFTHQNMTAFLPDIQTVEHYVYAFEKRCITQYEDILLSRSIDHTSPRGPPSYI